MLMSISISALEASASIFHQRKYPKAVYLSFTESKAGNYGKLSSINSYCILLN